MSHLPRQLFGLVILLVSCLAGSGIHASPEPQTPDAPISAPSPETELSDLLAVCDALEHLLEGSPDYRFSASQLLSIIKATPEVPDTAAQRDLLTRQLPVLQARLEVAVRSLGRTSFRKLSPLIKSNPRSIAAKADLDTEIRVMAARLAAAQLRLRILSLPQESASALIKSQQEAWLEHLRQLEKEKVRLAMEEQKARQAKALELAVAAFTEHYRHIERPLASREAILARQKHDQDAYKASVSLMNGELERRAKELTLQAGQATAGSSNSTILYDQIVDFLQEMRRQLDSELSEYLGQSSPDPMTLDLTGVPEPPSGNEQVLLSNLQSRVDALNAGSHELDQEMRLARLMHIRTVLGIERRINTLRIALLEKLPDEARSRILGFGKDGQAQFWREVHHLTLILTWQQIGGLEELATWWDELKAPYALLATVLRILAIIFVLSLALYLKRNHHVLGTRLEHGLAGLFRQASAARVVRTLMGAVTPILPQLVFLGAAWLIAKVILAPYVNLLEPVYLAVLAYFIYQITLIILFRGVSWATASGVPGVDERRSLIAMRSARMTGRFLVICTLTLSLSEAMLGKGYLYHLGIKFIYILLIPLSLTLVRWWRHDVVEAYLARRPSGTLSELVIRTRHHWYGFFIAIAALTVLSGITLAASVQKFILGFENSRKALAYLFRKRLERHAEVLADEEAADLLPDRVSDCLSLDPVSRPELLIDYFPGLPELQSSVSLWLKSESGNSWLLTGKAGVGKTQWLLQARELFNHQGISCAIHRPTTRLTLENTVLGFLEGVLPAGPDNVESAQKHPHIIMIDDAQFFFLRGVDALEGWQALMDTIESTRHRCFWIIACTYYTHDFIRWSLKGNMVFRHHWHLGHWTEENIGRLLQCRTGAAGLEVEYDDLILDKNDSAFASAQLLSTARDYNRLIWDYSMGMPRAALDAWRDSLNMTGPHMARVRLFHSVRSSTLEELDETALFVLAGVLWHGGISIADAARSLSLPEKSVARAMHAMLEKGILEERGTQCRIAVWWQASVNLFLRRQHLITD